MLVFDNAKLEACARAVRIVNPYARPYSVAELVTCMRATALSAFTPDKEAHGYVSTRGYVLSCYRLPDNSGDFGVHASVATHCVLEHANAE